MDQSINFKGIEVSFRQQGKGKTVVLLHGFLEDKTMWNFLFSELANKYRLIAIDLPGHGQTGNLAYIHSMEEMAEMVKAVTDSLNIRKMYLVGHSMGGYVSLAFGELFPDAVYGISLMYSTAFADSDQKKKDRDRAIEAVKYNYKRFIRQAIPNLFRPKSRPIFRTEINDLKQEALKMNPQGIVAALEGMKNRIDREVLLHFGAFPFQIIAGAHDPVIPKAVSQALFSGKKVTHSLMTPNGHMGFIEDREEVVQGLKAFLAKPL